MNKSFYIPPPISDEDTAGAHQVFVEFSRIYQPVLHSAENHLEILISRTEPSYAAGYKSWHAALHDLAHGVYMINRDIPVPDIQRFISSIHMFTFDSAVQFLKDLCRTAKIPLPKDWEKQFRSHIDLLLFSIAIINGELLPEMAH